MRGPVRVGLVVSLLGVVTPVPVGAQDANAGKAVYERRCLLCHGEKGDGKGPAAERLNPRPRDFTSGVYKIRTTADRIPSDQDLFDIITRGMPGTSMPSWEILSERDRRNLVAYLKTFAPDKFSQAPKQLELPRPVSASSESIARGKEMFEAIECNKCHGEAGRGDGPSMPELKDDWGDPIKPANLTKAWTFRGGSRAVDIATRLAGGVLGTPMPSFIDSVEKPEDIWHLTNYVLSLGPSSPRYATLVGVTAVTEALPDDPDAEFWKRLAPSNVPLMGQVIVDPRNFNPAIDMVSIRAAWNEAEIAFHLTWDDPTQSVADPGEQTFADALVLQFPPSLGDGTERPYFLMGDASSPVYLLGWESGRGVHEDTASGPDKVSPLPGSEATGKMVFAHGQYRVVVKRARLSTDPNRPGFEPRRLAPVAFQARDGGAGETGTKMSLTSWYYLRLEESQSNRRFVIPPLVTLGTAVALLLVVRAARNRA
jgi:DMSO reductase family type II enzyme heme b subunit